MKQKLYCSSCISLFLFYLLICLKCFYIKLCGLHYFNFGPHTGFTPDSEIGIIPDGLWRINSILRMYTGLARGSGATIPSIWPPFILSLELKFPKKQGAEFGPLSSKVELINLAHKILSDQELWKQH